MHSKNNESGFDAKLSELQRIIGRLEDEDLPLETGIGLFKEGVELAKSCRRQLESAKNEVMVLSLGLVDPLERDASSSPTHDTDQEIDDESLPF